MGVNVNSVINSYGSDSSLLNEAAKMNDAIMVKKLLKRGANPQQECISLYIHET